MKTPTDPRHRKRLKKVQALFSYSFGTSARSSSIAPILDKLKDLDELIRSAAPEWPLDKINKLDLAILRVATYELTTEKDTPQKVVIDEAVEIAKAYGAENSPAFVNGVLGHIIKEQAHDK